MDRNSKRCAGQGYLGKTLKALAVVAMASGLSGCFVSIPPAVQFASYALDAVVFIETDKTISDHALSAVTDRDCAVSRVLRGYEICHEDAQVSEMGIDRDIHTFELTPSVQDAANEAPSNMGVKSTRGMTLEEILNTSATSLSSEDEVAQLKR